MSAKVILMPKMGNTVESVIIGEIFIKVGDIIKKNQSLFDYETDKSTTEYNSELDGKVIAILMEEGDEIDVLSNIIVIGEDGDDISEFTSGVIKEKEVKKEVISDKLVKVVSQKIEVKRSDEAGISPRALKSAGSLGVNTQEIIGSGILGRIVETDVLKYYHSNAQKTTQDGNPNSDNTPEFIRVDYTPTRKAISKAMEASLHSGSQLTLGANFDATAIMKLRSEIKANYESLGIENSSINDIIIFALSRVLPRFPHLNAVFSEDRTYTNQYNVAHISVAVDAPKGLITPVIKNSTSLSLSGITRQTKDLISKAIEGKLKRSDISGGTFTISNLGLSGVSFFTPILNPPQVAILGVGSAAMKLRFDKDKNIQEYPEIMLSLTMDHGPSDGAAGTAFLKELKNVLENINVLFL